jgi:cobalt-zinc-cadmium efflux system membrane fusion protein
MENNINISMNKLTFSYLMAISIFLLSSCSGKTDLDANMDTTQDAAMENVYTLSTKQFESSDMELGTMVLDTFHEIVNANGMFNVPPENRATVSSYFGGTVKNLKLLTGERVKKGQVLFYLENPEYVQLQQDFLEAKGQLTFLKSDYERQKNLVQDNVTSQKNYLKAESDYVVTNVKVEALSKKLALMNIDSKLLSLDNIRSAIAILSPINGYVTEVAVTQGTFLNPAQPAISIVDTDHMHLELNIFEKDLAKIDIGQSLQFRIQDDVSHEYQASVYLVNKTIDPEKRTVGVHCHLKDVKQTNKFTPGMYVEADIYTTTLSRMALPLDALVEIDGNHYVLVLQSRSDTGYVFTKKMVRTGLSNTHQIEILNSQDFEEDAQFLVKGSFNLITE